MNNHFIQQDVDELTVVAHAVIKSLETTKGSRDSFHDRIKKSVSGHHGVYFLVADKHKNILYKSDTPNLTPLLSKLDPIKKINVANLLSWKQDNFSYRGSLIRFHRVDWSRKRSLEGLGLAITRSIVQFHQNKIRIKAG
ncbi:MAG: hypothetical protein L3J46_09025 [Kangiellaceae bacterium]|nr:hypothetical protein [Kangiellaceae bacterium]